MKRKIQLLAAMFVVILSAGFMGGCATPRQQAVQTNDLQVESIYQGYDGDVRVVFKNQNITKDIEASANGGEQWHPIYKPLDYADYYIAYNLDHSTEYAGKTIELDFRYAESFDSNFDYLPSEGLATPVKIKLKETLTFIDQVNVEKNLDDIAILNKLINFRSTGEDTEFYNYTGYELETYRDSLQYMRYEYRGDEVINTYTTMPNYAIYTNGDRVYLDKIEYVTKDGVEYFVLTDVPSSVKFKITQAKIIYADEENGILRTGGASYDEYFQLTPEDSHVWFNISKQGLALDLFKYAPYDEPNRYDYHNYFYSFNVMLSETETTTDSLYNLGRAYDVAF